MADPRIDESVEEFFELYLLHAWENGWEWEDEEDLRIKFQNWASGWTELWADDEDLLARARKFEEGMRKRV